MAGKRYAHINRTVIYPATRLAISYKALQG